MRRIKIVVWLLAGLAVLLMGIWATLFLRLLEADRVIATRVREDAMWAMFQADRHAATLLHLVRETLTSKAPERHPEVMQTYDILFSRAQLLDRGTFGLDLTIATELGQASLQRTQQVQALAEMFDALDPAHPDYLSELAQLLPEIMNLRQGLSNLLLTFNHAMSESRVKERTARKVIHDQLALSAGFLVLAFFGIGALLAFQLRQLQAAHARMARLRKISSQQAIKARAASAAKSTFLATMSHEIRTPLNAIIGSAELMGTSGLGAAQRQRVDTIQSAGLLLLDVINDILDFSKLDGRTFETVQEPVDLPEIARTIETTFAARATSRNLKLTLRFAPVRISTDPGRLRQVIVNLVGNALKFTQIGEVEASAFLTETQRLRVEVRDTGIGVRPEDIDRLFRDFQQIDGSYARAYGGTGLGLAICKRIVEGLNGKIGVKSTFGTGSTFWFEIPVVPLGAAHDRVDKPANLLPALTETSAPLRILIVEDNPINRQVLGDQLLRLGHHPSLAETGFVALDRLSADTFDLVLMDMQMPGISGPDTTRALRRAGHKLPVIGVTANASTEDRNICKAAGMEGFLPKPVTLARLAEAIAEVFPQARSSTVPREAAGPNLQLDDLRASLGDAMVKSLLDQYDASLGQTETELMNAYDKEDASAMDTALHTLKGAALTLGLHATGLKAQALRPPAKPDADAIVTLFTLAREDLIALRASLGSSPQDTA